MMAFCVGSLMSLCLSQTNFGTTNPPSAETFAGTRKMARNGTKKTDITFCMKIGS